MGWLWANSKSSQPLQANQQQSPPELPSNSASENPSAPTAPFPSSQSPPKPLSRDEQADAELQSLLREFEAPSSSTTTPTPSTEPSPSAKPQESKTQPLSPSPIGPSIYPSSFSCRSFFDQAYYCQLPGGQFINVYRYGSLRDCSELWSNFWFCMRTNRGYMSEEERAERVRGFYRERERRLLSGPNSEEVWRARGQGEGVAEEAFRGGLGGFAQGGGMRA